MSDYATALEAAGCIVHAFKSFGSYQGNWYAYVTYMDENETETGFITGSFGSCSGCDSFQAEFDYNGNDPVKLANFGKTYLPVRPVVYVLEEIKSTMRYDSDAQEVHDWVIKVTNEIFAPLNMVLSQG